MDEEWMTRNWPTAEDPAVHVAVIQKVLVAGTTNNDVHSGETDQQRVTDLYGGQVLPRHRGEA